MPGKHTIARFSEAQAPEYDYYRISGEGKPETAVIGDRLLEPDTGKKFVYYRGDWQTEPDTLGDILAALEELTEEVAKQTPAAEAILEKL